MDIADPHTPGKPRAHTVYDGFSEEVEKLGNDMAAPRASFDPPTGAQPVIG